MGFSLMDQIEAKRQEMISQGIEKGFSHQETVKTSQELDKLLNLLEGRERNANRCEHQEGKKTKATNTIATI